MKTLEDLRFSLRLMAGSPLYTGLSVFCLAAGIGLSTFMFSISYSIVGRGLPFPNQDGIMTIMQRDAIEGGDNRSAVLVDDYRAIREQQTHFSHFAALTGDMVTVGYAGFPNLMNGMYTSPDLFEIMPGKAFMGRTFTEEDAEAGANPVLVLSHKAWVSDFASDPEIIGKECMAEGKPYTIIGVMPKGYDYPFGSTRVWMPLVPENLLEQTGWIDRVLLLGQLQGGSTEEEAFSELQVIFKRLQLERGDEDAGRFQPDVRPIMELFLNNQIRLMMWTMFGATLLVLLIACTNVSSLFTARLAARENELAVRSALGANRRRIISQILSESMLAAAFGTFIGLLLSWRALKLLWNQLENFQFSPPSFMEFRMDGVSIVVAIALMFTAVIFASLLPAIRASRTNLTSLLNDSGRTSSNLRLSRFGTISPIVQLAFSLALLVAAGRMIYGIIALTSVEYPFEKEGLLIGSIAVDSSSYPTEEEQIRFWDELHRNLGSLPAARSVSLGFNIPTIPGMMDNVQIEGEEYMTEEDYPWVRFNVVTPGYFNTIGVELIQGRDFNWGDVKGNESVAIINTTMAERFWPGEDPVGQYFKTSDRGNLDEEERMHRVIGIVPDLSMHGLFNEEEDGSGYYRSQGQGLWGDQKIIVRGEGNPSSMIPEIQKIISRQDPNIAFTNAKPFTGHIEDTLFYFRFFLNLFSSFGVMALLLAATGVYGIIQYVVSQRTTEIGIRLSLGATGKSIRMMILKKGMRNAIIGIVIGSGFALGLNTVLSGTFPFLENEYYSYSISVIILLLVSFFANLIPAGKASRLNPMTALRVK